MPETTGRARKARWPPVVAAVVNVGSLCAGFALVCTGLRALLPFPEIMSVTRKAEFLQQHAGEYDVIFFGSSRIYHQIIPSLFDQLMAERGMPVRSFNAGVDGMHMPELGYFAEQALAGATPRLKWIFLEAGPIRAGVGDEKRGTVRALYWHDWSGLVTMLDDALSIREVPKRKAPRGWQRWADAWPKVRYHTALFLERFSNLGRGAALLAGNQPAVADLTSTIGPNLDGYIAPVQEGGMTPANREHLLRSVADRAKDPSQRDTGDPASRRALNGLLQSFDRRGATAVQIIPPTTQSRLFWEEGPPGARRLVLNYTDVKKYAELFTPENRLNDDHVNARGAELFTRLLVAEFLAKMEAEQAR